MPAYESYFASPATAKKQWNLSDLDAKNVCELWELTENEMSGTYADALETDAQDFYRKQTYVDPNLKVKTIKKSISAAQLRNLVDLYRGSLVMRALSSENAKARAAFEQIWQPLWGRMEGDDKPTKVGKAKKLASVFNNLYLQDEQVKYLQYLTGAKKNPLAFKPYLIESGGKFKLQVWHKP